MNRKGFSLPEIMVSVLIFASFMMVMNQVFFGSRKAFIKTMDAQTLNEVAQRIVAHLKNDIQSSNYVVQPSLDGDTSETLILMRQIPDFTADPATATGADGSTVKTASVAYKTRIIKYSVEQDEDDETETFKVLRRQEILVEPGSDTDEVIVGRFNSTDASNSSPGRIEKMWFYRASYHSASEHPTTGKSIPIPPEPHENGCGPSVVNVKLFLRNPTLESGPDGGYSVDLDFALQVRGGAL